MSVTRWMAIVGMAWALGACARSADEAGVPDDAVDPNNGAVGGACRTDGDCPTGQGCFAAAKACVAFLPEPEYLSVGVEPAPAGALLPDQYAGLLVSPQAPLDLTLTTPVTVTGAVVHAQAGAPSTSEGFAPGAAEGDLPVGGRIIATAPGRVPGTQFRSEARTTDQDGVQRFTLRILPGVAYQVTFLPDAPAADGDPLPPFFFALQADGDLARDVVLPARGSYVRVSGIVLSAGEKVTPLPGAQVFSQVGTAAIGTSAVTDAAGQFTVLVPPMAGEVRLEVRPGPSVAPFPVRRVAYAGTSELADAVATTPVLAIEVDGAAPRRQVSVQVLGTVDGQNQPVEGATVRLTGAVGDGTLTFTGTTDGVGVATLSVLEAAYEILVLPPQESEFASMRSAVDLAANSGDAFLMRLDRRVDVSGTVVRHADGTAIPGALVSFLTDRLGAPGAGQVVGQEASFDAVTDALGAFHARVDPGVYAVNVIPPVSSGLARFTQPTLDLTVARSLVVPLPRGALVRGRLSAALPADVGGTEPGGVTGAKVRFYFDLEHSRSGEAWSLQGTSFAPRLQQAGEADSGEGGVFEALVPVLVGGASLGGLEPGSKDGDAADGGFGLPPVELL